MGEIYKKKSGFALITSLIIMSLLLLLVTYVISFTLTEIKISNSQNLATKNYYLAESAIAEAIWKIKNDPTWKINFETNPNWSHTYTRDPAIYPNGSYKIQINNTGYAQGEIIATGLITLGKSTSQRIVKTTIYKALGETIIGNSGVFTDEDIDIDGTVLNIYNGGSFSNDDTLLNLWSTLNVDESARAVDDISISWTSTINASSIESDNYPPAPDSVNMPAISFDNEEDSNSYYSQADNIYTENEFSNLLWDNNNLTLDGITYITGDVEIKADQNLTINGILVADGDITIGKNTFGCCWCQGIFNCRCGRSDIEINKESTTTPSGILTKGKMDFELCLDNFQANGLLYANDRVNIFSFPGNFYIEGGIITRKLELVSIWQGVNITFSNETINYTLGNPQFSPIVTVEHWEEEY